MKVESDFDFKNPGWMNDEELAILKKVCEGKSDVLEIGCYCGRSTRALLDGSMGLVIAVDPLHRNGRMPSWPTPDGVLLDTHAHMSRLVAEYPERLIVFPSFSNEIFKLFRRSIDVLFIDSDHGYPSTKYEIDVFGPLIKDTGWLVLDDFDVEPVSSSWRDSDFKKDRPWLQMTQMQSLGVCHVVQKVAENPPEIEKTPCPEVLLG